MKTLFRAALLAAAALMAAAPAGAQSSYPRERPVTIVVPFGPGGTTDLLGRILAEKLGQKLGGTFIVENKAGAGGNTGVAGVARATPDGYTLTMGTVSTHSINPNVYKSMPFDHVKDFAPVSLVAAVPNILIANPELPAKTVPELIELLKKNPGKYAHASSGPGTSTHMAAELFKLLSGTDMVHVPYRSSNEVVRDLLAGVVQVTFDNITIAWPQVEAGKLRALATATPKRLEIAPDLPALSEFLPGFAATSWHGLFAPAGTPDLVVDRLSQAVQEIMRDPEVVERLKKLGVTAIGSTRPEFAKHIADETERWGKVAKSANISIQ